MNPYTPASKQLFYGREMLFRSLLQNEESGQSVVLIGGRRCGKTCLMERIQYYLQQAANPNCNLSEAWEKTVPDAGEMAPERNIPHRWPVFIDFQGIGLDSLEQVLGHMAQSIAECKAPLKRMPAISPVNGLDAAQLEKWLKEVDGCLEESKIGGLALLLDEIEELFAKPWHHDLMAFLRRLDDFSLKSRVWFLLAGCDALDNYRNECDGSPPLNTTKRMFLPDLGYPARRRMAVEPFVTAGRLPPSDDVLREVDRLAGGNVWILTLLLEYLYNIDEISLVKVRDAAGRLLEQQGDIFHRWSKAIGKYGWEMYGKVANLGLLESKHIKGSHSRSLRAVLEYQALVHRRQSGDIEMGPELFRDWAFEEGKIKEPFVSRPVHEECGEFPPGYYPYDVAISYASPQRRCAKELAEALGMLGKKVFFDQDLGHELWGVDLEHCLPGKYDREALLTVLLISKDYAARYWPKVEAKAALTKAMREGWNAVLLISLDGARCASRLFHDI
ncbi:MAG: toll/interleukin-1 receptor domain-containing protein [Candidatus Aminicenantes bacterium]|nr:MAG: toll/interleukin-1 receptor domain-containing protein [Candidatus Aminicenantes bacterium]